MGVKIPPLLSIESFDKKPVQFSVMVVKYISTQYFQSKTLFTSKTF